MSLSKIKKGDEVIVLSGKSKGAKGVVLRVLDDGSKVLVEGANMIKKHVRPNPNKNEPGGILEREAPMAISKVAIFNPIAQKADKVVVKILENGKKVRCFKSNGEFVDKV